MIVTLIKSRVEKWMDGITQTAIRDGIAVWRVGPEIKPRAGYLPRPRRQVIIPDQVQLNIGRAYIVLTSAIAISAGILDQPAVGFTVWFFGLVVPLIALIWWRHHLTNS